LLRLSLDNPRTQDLKPEFIGKTLKLTEKNLPKPPITPGTFPSGPLPGGALPGALVSSPQNPPITTDIGQLPEFKIGPDQNLSVALRNYLSSVGWKLSWDAIGEGKSKIRDFKLAEEFSMKPKSITELIQTLLRNRSVKADIWVDDKRVVVTNPEKEQN